YSAGTPVDSFGACTTTAFSQLEPSPPLNVTPEAVAGSVGAASLGARGGRSFAVGSASVAVSFAAGGAAVVVGAVWGSALPFAAPPQPLIAIASTLKNASFIQSPHVAWLMDGCPPNAKHPRL